MDVSIHCLHVRDKKGGIFNHNLLEPEETKKWNYSNNVRKMISQQNWESCSDSISETDVTWWRSQPWTGEWVSYKSSLSEPRFSYIAWVIRNNVLYPKSINLGSHDYSKMAYILRFLNYDHQKPHRLKVVVRESAFFFWLAADVS